MTATKKDEMLDEYDFTNGVRGKYVDRVANKKNVIALEPDTAQVFTDSDSVKDPLRESSRKINSSNR